MTRRPLLALSAPLALLACLLGHLVGYALAGPAPAGHALHGYLAYAPLLVALCCATAVVALGLRATGRLPGRPSAFPLAVIGPLAFLVQELAERLAAGLPASALLERPVLAGLLAQLPLALAAYLLARWLLRAADAVAAWLARTRATVRSVPSTLWPAVEASLPRPHHRHTGCGRAPPRLRLA